jgi:4-hydroxy-tetrahydrodipicolinate synthase
MTITMFCVSQTPFDADLRIDEAALRAHLRRVVAAGNGVYVGSPGAGEGYALSVSEYRRLFEIAVDEVAGRVPLHANPREARTADEMLEIADQAVAAGIDVVSLYQLDAGHGATPSEAEQSAYWDRLLGAIDHPVAISIHGQSPYSASVDAIADLCRRYERIVVINVMGGPNQTLVQLRDTLPDRVALHTNHANLIQAFTLGAVGALGQENNIVPRTCRALANAYERGDREGLEQTARMLQRLAASATRAAGASGSARWIKLGLQAIGHGNGVLRPPYLPSSEAQVRQVREAFDAAGVWALEQALTDVGAT